MLEPISLRVLLRSLIFFSQQKQSSSQELENNLNVTADRAKAIVRQLTTMGLLEKVDTEFRCAPHGKIMVNAVQASHWSTVHDILQETCKEYDALLKVLKSCKVGDKGLMISQVVKLSAKFGRGLNRVTTDVCCEWGRRLGKIQKNLFTSGVISRFYLIHDQSIPLNNIENEIHAQYARLGKGKRRLLIYVSVPRLRENVCETLKISRRRFDGILLEISKRNTGEVELASGPLTSRSRTAPTRKLSIYVDRKAAVLSPNYILEAEEGLDVGGKKYQTIAFHRRDHSV